MIRRSAERKLLTLISAMTLGEKIALARRAHRPIFGALMSAGEPQVFSAILDNPRLTENDILVILNTTRCPTAFFTELARHHRWGHYLGIRRGLVRCRLTPLPIVLSLIVQLPSLTLRNILEDPALRDEVREAITALLDREAIGERRVIRFSGDDSDGGAAQPSEDIR
jgi:hypothetical protein